jgi:uncharacterized protein (DUF488 family)
MEPIYTVGHGTKTIEEFIEILVGPPVSLLVDVRRYPGSRRHPHFARESLERSLIASDIDYQWRGEELGGRRSRVAGSPHTALRVAAFQGYADHMDGASFREALARLMHDAETETVAIMCAETLWWRCHRRMIADALLGAGAEVIHLMGPGKLQPHKLHPAARLENGRPVYDVGTTGRLSV